MTNTKTQGTVPTTVMMMMTANNHGDHNKKNVEKEEVGETTHDESKKFGPSSTTTTTTRPTSTTTTPDLLIHAPSEDDSDRNETVSTASPPPSVPGAFKMLPASTAIIGRDVDCDTNFEEYHDNGDDVDVEQVHRRDSSFSADIVKALPVEKNNEPIQAQVLKVVGSQHKLHSGGTQWDGDEKMEHTKRRLTRKTKAWLVRFSVIFVIVFVAAIAIVVVVLSSSNKNGDNIDTESRSTPPPVTMPSEALPSLPVLPPLPPSRAPMSTPTPSPTTTEQGKFLDLLQSRSPTTSFENATSPQSKALRWLFSHTCHSSSIESFAPERWLQQFALVTFFFATGGESTWEEDVAAEWLQITFDNLPITECNWPGLSCDGNGSLVHLIMSEFGLSGTLPPEVGLLPRLKYFSVKGKINQIGGTIPSEFGLSTDLFRLNLVANKLEGTIPTELGLLTNLEYLGLGVNSFLSGEIPTHLMSLSKLTDLSLNSNRLQSTIPSEIGQLTALNQLLLFENNINGPLPTALGRLTQLHVAFLDENEFSGSIPSELGHLTVLESLYLSNNRFEKTIPTELGQMTRLQRLMLKRNLLEGPIPTESLAELTQLTRLNIAHNSALTGTIPSSLCPANGGLLEKVSFGRNQAVTFDCPVSRRLRLRGTN